MADDGLERARRAYEVGNLSGMWDALVICQQQRLPLPDWLNGALGKTLIDYFRTSKDGAKWFRRWKQDLIEYERWDLVASADDHRGGLRRAAGQTKSSDPELSQHITEQAFEFSWTNERIYEKAREELEEQGRLCGVDAIKKSYQKVQRGDVAPERHYYRNLPGFLANLFWTGKLR